MDAIRRADDNELCGFVDEATDGWHALTVFGSSLGAYPTKPNAADAVLREGLASLMERWLLSGDSGEDEEIVCIQEAHPDAVTVVLGYYSLPGVPTMRIERAELDAARWTLRLNR